MMKLLSIIFLMMLFSVPSGISADGHSAESAITPEISENLHQIVVDHQGWWLTGLLVGTLDSREWVDGVIWNSGELEVLTGNGSQPGRYPSFQYLLSVEGQASELWQNLMDVRGAQNFIFEYRSKAFWSSPFSSESDLILTNIASGGENFLDTQTYKTFPDGVEVELDYHNTWFFRERVSRGLVTRVQRVNRRLLSNQCIIDVHMGGSRNIANYRDEWVPRQNSTSESGIEEEAQAYLTSRKEYLSVPDVGQFTTYNESFCRYAEVAAVTSQEVNILYSDFWSSGENLVETELYKIWVESPE
ncbi:hypothetical protein [Endozoicomonas sp.]|uniref:hypothetical protein n=1 Tax=Endozoicomonas sp. TaxID=1892382 RepID=UPI00288495B7|nr:hypothetical protein [Endozoicomonas sp.]